MSAFLIILTGSLVATCCALLGCFLILRRMAMVGDAISHAVLPGIVIAFFIAGGLDSIWMIAGAGVVGMLSTFIIEFLHRRGRLQTDASIGVTFTWLFALGVILVTYYAGDAHIDQECVLYGEIAYVPIDLLTSNSGHVIAPKATVIMGTLLMLLLAFILLFYKELFITTFDPAYAAAIGISTALWHYLLMGMVSLTTVASFESVGAILVVAFLIVPPATAYLVTRQLNHMLWLSVGFGILSAIMGYYLASWIDGSIAGAMVTVAGLQFALVFGGQQLKKNLRLSPVPPTAYP